jgi:hypothetical protein
MYRFKQYLNIWTGLGVLLGIFVVPRVLKGRLGNMGWNPNWGFWRPLGIYSVGALKELTPLEHYRGSEAEHQLAGELNPITFYAGGTRQLGYDPIESRLGQAYFTGESPFWAGFQGEFKPTGFNAPERKWMI